MLLLYFNVILCSASQISSICGENMEICFVGEFNWLAGCRHLCGVMSFLTCLEKPEIAFDGFGKTSIFTKNASRPRKSKPYW